jgi:hypothetical protein
MKGLKEETARSSSRNLLGWLYVKSTEIMSGWKGAFVDAKFF